MTLLRLAALFVLAVPTFGAPVPDNDPQVELLIKQIAFKVKARDAKDDDKVIEDFKKLAHMWKDLGPKDRAAVLNRADRCFKLKRKKFDDGTPNDFLFRGLAELLGEFTPESDGVLIDWIGHKRFRDNLPLQRELILSLGKTGTEDAAEELIDLLPHVEPVVQGAAAEALGHFAGAEEDLRKEAFEAILKQLVPLHNLNLVEPVDPIEERRYQIIAAPMVTTLQRLSKHDETDPPAWQRWWNKNKKVDWE